MDTDALRSPVIRTLSWEQEIMKPQYRRLFIAVAFILTCVIGVGIGVFGASHQYYKYVFSGLRDRQVEELSIDLNLLAHLRLGEFRQAIGLLEQQADRTIVSVGLDRQIPTTDLRRRVLKQARTYREYYPSESQYAPHVAEALDGIPIYKTFTDDDGTCNSAFCRIVRREGSKEAKDGEPSEEDR